ncbi:recQ-mediated genome instability protein 1 [Phragmites australis]|uniref:recQ-mediated genome instability protein 1 n=1 Tax=Phragmites australis TaxID=29695 RepID=UPI002D765E22|nr:recQ-mediated genome instability protein 1 [Phragmites australis]
MRRRNLIIDSDDEDGEGIATSTSASASASVASGGDGSVGRPSPRNPSPLPVPFPCLSPPSAPVVISDDDEFEEIVDPDGDSPFTDAPDELSPPPLPAPAPAPPPSAARTPTLTTPPAGTPTPTPSLARNPSPTAPPASTPPPSALSGRLRPVDELLRGLGLRMRPEWLESCAAGIPGFNGLGGPEVQARRCFEQFLFADMNACGAGGLPEGVGGMHASVLDGPFVLQVDEIVNMSAPLRERYRDTHAGPKRCLKLSMTDGIQRVFGMEYRPIKDLQVLAPAGLKVVIRNVHIRRGLLMLLPEVIEILGGVVDELEAARDRLVSEVNKPPRGKRKQGGLPLSSRAALAAWQCSINVTNGGGQGISMPRTVTPSHPTGLVNAFQVGRTTETMVEGHVSPPVVVNSVQEQSLRVQEINMQDPSASLARNNTETSAYTPRQYDRTHSIERITQTIREEYVEPPIIANNAHEQIQCVQEIAMQEQATAFARTERKSSASTPCSYDTQHGSYGIGGTGANDVVAAQSSNLDDEFNQEHSMILSGENEKPFTYIISMLADWGIQQDTKAYIQGKIKGLITSVKSFQFKRRTEYELYVYIDDGSYISVAFVDSDIVKNIIGHSPGEVTSALSGESNSTSASTMKEILKGFQSVLVKFEGMMLIEFNKNSSIPIVRELNEGCPSSDAWLLLRRLKTFSYQTRVQNLDIMDTTP